MYVCVYIHMCLYIHLCVYVSNNSKHFEFEFDLEFESESPYRAGPSDEQEGPVLEDVHAAPVIGLCIYVCVFVCV
jgi:hypothetical protein